MLRTFYDKGVREFDLLQVVPFGRAFTEGRDTLFYDLEAMQPYLREALEFSRRPDVHVWMNRFPPKHLEGFEHLIQDPYKLNDEVRGRKEEFARLLDEGEALDCREPSRCRYCYLEQLCDTLDAVRATVAAQRFEVVRVDTAWEAQQAPVFGGDPASARRARADGRIGLPLAAGPEPRTTPTPAELVAAAGATTLRLVAPDLASARAALPGFATPTELELELHDPAGLAAALAPDGSLEGRRLTRVLAHRSDDARALLALPFDFEVQVALHAETAAWLRTLAEAPARLSLVLPTYERLTESQTNDVDLRAFFEDFAHPVPVEGVPACVLGRAPRAERPLLDTAMMDANGRLEIFRYTQRYILAHYRTKSLRCAPCVHAASCTGMHINYVRAHGYDLMQPVTATAAAE
jgi:hypothetical protein